MSKPKEIEATVYTKLYQPLKEEGWFEIPDTKLFILTRYIGLDAHENKHVEDCLTIALSDENKHFWPLILKLSDKKAEEFYRALGKTIRRRKKKGPVQQAEIV